MRLVAGVMALAAVALPSAATAAPGGSAGQPTEPGCFGQLARTGAEAGIVGEFVRANAQRYKDSEESNGNTGVPFLKFLACGYDARGREPRNPTGDG